MSIPFQPSRLFSSRRQNGVASIEFALIASLMILMLLGLFVWWRYFQASQILNKAAGDGARAVHSMVITGTAPCLVSNASNNITAIENRMETVIKNQLNYDGLSSSNLTLSKKVWVCSKTGTESFSFDIHYQLPSLFLEGNYWITEPTSLSISDKIIVHFPSQS